MPVPRNIRRSDPYFEDSWAACSYEANLPKDQFDRQLLDAVNRLLKAGPKPEDGPDEIKWAPITDEYRLAYNWVTDRDKKGRPISYHLVLLLVEHI
jgi:hypothetical protein